MSTGINLTGLTLFKIKKKTICERRSAMSSLDPSIICFSSINGRTCVSLLKNPNLYCELKLKLKILTKLQKKVNTLHNGLYPAIRDVF